MPEWGTDLWLGLKIDEHWIVDLLQDVYAAAGMKSFALSVMGARAIIEYIVTSKAGPKPKKGPNSFENKLKRMHAASLIPATSVDEIFAAYDAGSASVHRGFRPADKHVFTLLDITENCWRRFT